LLEAAGHPARSDVFIDEGKRRTHVRVLGDRAVDLGSGPQPVAARWIASDLLELEAGASSERVRVARCGERLQLVRGGRRRNYRIVPREEAFAAHSESQGACAEAIAAPFPGQVAELRVKVGDRVREGEVVVVLEAMKMLHNLAAAGEGVVAEIRCQPGAAVAAGELLVRFESAPSSGAK
jgi:biotin carboxyl carrier protein